MAYSQTARTPSRGIRIRRLRVAALLVVVAAVVAALDHQSSSSSSSTSASSIAAEHRPADGAASDSARVFEHGGTLGEADGAVPDGTTVFDDGVPGVANLKADLLSALRHAATNAASDGVELQVDSGWRSSRYQQQLLREAVSKYGSPEEAARWVATPETSAHVSGDAVDVGPSNASTWLAEHGVAYGLCRVYGNEPWHFELRPQASAQGCPPVYADPSHDPRLRP